MREEAELQHAIFERYGASPHARIWRSNTGVAFDATGRPVRFGVKGAADISGILMGGRRLEIEVKSKTGRQTAEQKAFGEMIKRMGGIYILARKIEDVDI